MTTTPTPTTTAAPVTLFDAVNALVEKRIIWEQGTYAASNAELYSILGDCLDLFAAVKRSYDLPKCVNALLAARDIDFKSSTRLEVKLVRLVFADATHSDRINKRLYTYARVIRVAAEAGHSSATLAQFIADNHGIEEIRRNSQGGLTVGQKHKVQAEHARNRLVTPSDSEISDKFALPDQLQPQDGEYFSLALVRKNADGTGSIVFGTNNVSAVNTVLAIAGKALRDEATQIAEQQIMQRDDEIKSQNAATLQTFMSQGTNASTPQFAPQLSIPNAAATAPMHP